MIADPARPILDEAALNIFTDGSSLPKPRRGGIGYRLVWADDDGHEVTDDSNHPGFEGGTNQEMELKAPTEALKYVAGRYAPVNLGDFTKVVIWTDSSYVASNVRNAQFRWPQERWTGRDGNPIENAHLWKQLTKAIADVGRRVEFEWCKGHKSTNPHNRAVDKLAKASAQGHLEKPVSVGRVRRKKTVQSTELGSIRAEGQRITVRVVSEKTLPVQRAYLYKSEVMSPGSPYFGKVDNLYSELLLRAGHTYEVTLSGDSKAPWIMELHGEVPDPPAA